MSYKPEQNNGMVVKHKATTTHLRSWSYSNKN